MRSTSVPHHRLCVLRMSTSDRSRTAFTLFEMLVAVSILAIFAVVVLPRMSDERMLRNRAASSILISDIEYAQTLNITYPDDPVIVRFSADGDRYWLAYEETPNQPLTRQDTGETYEVVWGQGRAMPASGIELEFDDLPDETLAFNAQGGLQDFRISPRIIIRPKGSAPGTQEIELRIAPTTGRITEHRY